MVNHVRTLLLNEPAASPVAALAPWPMDSAFPGVGIGTGLSVFRDALFLDADTGERRIRRVEDAYAMTLAPDLRVPMEAFDPRATPLGRPPVSVASFAAGLPFSGSGYGAACIDAAIPSGVLYEPSDSPLPSPLKGALSWLRNVFSASSHDVRLGACILAYAVRLEALRLSDTGVAR